MRRRDLVLLAATALVAPRAAPAQTAQTIRRVGYFTAVTGSPEDLFGVEQTRALVASLGRPGGNATGIGVNEAPLAGKWVELLKEIAPAMTRALLLMAAESRPQQLLGDAVAAAAPPLGLALVSATVSEPADYDREI